MFLCKWFCHTSSVGKKSLTISLFSFGFSHLRSNTTKTVNILFHKLSTAYPNNILFSLYFTWNVEIFWIYILWTFAGKVHGMRTYNFHTYFLWFCPKWQKMQHQTSSSELCEEKINWFIFLWSKLFFSILLLSLMVALLYFPSTVCFVTLCLLLKNKTKLISLSYRDFSHFWMKVYYSVPQNITVSFTRTMITNYKKK